MQQVATLALLASACSAQVATEANRSYTTKDGRASVVAILDRPDREGREKPRELVAALDLKPGMTVIDLGTGPGYMLPYLSPAVGDTGRVIAEDIQQDFLDRAREKAHHADLRNVAFVLGSDRDPRLPPAAADLILVLDAYHHFDYPERMLASLKTALKPGGRLAIVEYHKKRGAMAGDPDRALTHIRLPQEDLIREIEANGFKLLWNRDHVPDSQYIAMFEMR